jgi:chromosome segregation ATPase
MDSATIAIITAALSFTTSIVATILSYFQGKKKADSDAVNILLNNAIALNKQEIQTIRDINKILVDDKVSMQAKIKEDEEEIKELERECSENKRLYTELKAEYDMLKGALGNCQEKVNILIAKGDDNHG